MPGPPANGTVVMNVASNPSSHASDASARNDSRSQLLQDLFPFAQKALLRTDGFALVDDASDRMEGEGAQSMKQLHEPWLVVWSDRAQQERRAVGQLERADERPGVVAFLPGSAGQPPPRRNRQPCETRGHG